MMVSAHTFQRVAETLKDRLLAEVKDHVHSIVLFGSVARGEATPDSDTDMLIIVDGHHETKRRIYEISYEVDLENGAFTQSGFFTPEGFENEVRMRSWLSSDLISQGIVLYDDGTYRRICDKAPPTFPGIPQR